MLSLLILQTTRLSRAADSMPRLRKRVARTERRRRDQASVEPPMPAFIAGDGLALAFCANPDREAAWLCRPDAGGDKEMLPVGSRPDRDFRQDCRDRRRRPRR